MKIESIVENVTINIDGQDVEAYLDYSQDNAQQLVENSSEFDNWLNEVVFDLDNFRSEIKKEDTKEAGDISGS